MSRSEKIALADGAYVLPADVVTELRRRQRECERSKLDHADALVAFDAACREVRRELVRAYGVDPLAAIELSADLSRATISE